ncbi:MAG: hypothetical protein DME07_21410 [Candidatus Rokuibacteriota bacterium]|nr:MAG: hypothetical protein DME07_21410 [Candidatus Rokubacteria bacterium]PYN52300.1 MAG: hypothetical protein DMD94_22990 [Candidatus Rokubacteria bacterium]
MVSIAVCPLAPSVSARQARVGVVTNVEGMAPVARVALPQPQPLRFKDDVFLKDRITSSASSMGLIEHPPKAWEVALRSTHRSFISSAPGTLNACAMRWRMGRTRHTLLAAVSRMGTWWRMAGGSLAEGHDAHRRPGRD